MVILNIALLAALSLGNVPNNRHQRHDDHRRRPITEVFDLTDQQVQKFEKSKRDHSVSIRRLNDDIKRSSRQYYLCTDEAEKDSLMGIVTGLNEQFYKANARHINDLRTIINPDQSDRLEQFVKGLTSNRPPRPPRR